MRKILPLLSIFCILGLAAVARAWGFGEVMGACEPECGKCHQISLEEATDLVHQMNPDIDVLEVRQGPVKGLWEVIVRAGSKKGIAYIDFSKDFIISGSVIKVQSKENVTNKRLYDISKVDVSAIPLGEALVMGDPGKARYSVVVFDDPD